MFVSWSFSCHRISWTCVLVEQCRMHRISISTKSKNRFFALRPTVRPVSDSEWRCFTSQTYLGGEKNMKLALCSASWQQNKKRYVKITNYIIARDCFTCSVFRYAEFIWSMISKNSYTLNNAHNRQRVHICTAFPCPFSARNVLGGCRDVLHRMFSHDIYWSTGMYSYTFENPVYFSLIGVVFWFPTSTLQERITYPTQRESRKIIQGYPRVVYWYFNLGLLITPTGPTKRVAYVDERVTRWTGPSAKSRMKYRVPGRTCPLTPVGICRKGWVCNFESANFLFELGPVHFPDLKRIKCWVKISW